MILLLRSIARLLTFVLLVALALAGIVVAAFCIGNGARGLSLAGLAELLDLGELRDWVGRRLASLESGSVSPAAALVGAGAVVLGLLLLIGTLAPRRERRVLLERTEHGTIDARRRPLAQAAAALAERVAGVTEAKVKLKVGRVVGAKRLRVIASRPRTASAGDVESRVRDALEPLARGFALRTRVDARLGRRGARVQ